LIATVINKSFAPDQVADFAWRLPFLLGGLFGLCSVYLRRWLHETPVFAELQQRKAIAAEIPLKAVLRDHGRAVIVSMLLTWMLSAAIVVVILMTPTLLQKQFHIAPATVLVANCAATLCLTIGCVLSGAIAGRIGAGKTIFVGGAALAVSYWMMFDKIAVDPSALLPYYALAGFFVGVIGAIPYVMVKSFPPAVRFSGISFSYNVAYAVFGGLTPIVVSLMMKSSPLAPAIYVGALCAVGALTTLFIKQAR
jgi:predicted MFS family arabinose efflux permease